jgi:hypothetical protein
MRRIALLASLVLVGVLGFATLADAHRLKKQRALRASANVAKQECNDIPSCVDYGAGPCQRINAHRVRCDAIVRDPLAQCEFKVRVRLTANGQLFYTRTPENNWNCGPRQRVA